MRLVNITTATLLVCAMTIAGCGGSPSAASQVRNVVNQFTVDLGQKHYAAACPLTTGGMRVVCQLGHAFLTPAQCQGTGNSEAGQACAANQQAEAQLGTFTGLTISKLVVQGTSATVTFNGSSEVMTVSKQASGWRISSG